MQDGEILFGLDAIADELSRLTGKQITKKQAGYWARRQVFRARKCGHFVTATKTSIREDFSPESAITVIAS